MATSGTYTFQMTRDQILTASLRKLGVIAEGQTPSSTNLTDGQYALNGAIAQLRSIGMPLWAKTEYTFTPTTNVYTIGDGMSLDTEFPVRLIQAYRTSTNTKIPMELVAREDFNILPASTSSPPLKLNYQPFINYGRIALWPTPDSTNTDTVTIVYQRSFQYFTSASETADLPEEWQLPLIYTTAVLLAPEWGVPLPDRQVLKAEAKEYTDMAKEVGQEDASFFLQPEPRR